MFPEAFKQRISNQKYIDAEALLGALEQPSPVSIRINPSKWNRIPLTGVQVPWSRNGYYLKFRPSYTLDPLFHSGCYYPQEASGMILEHAVRQSVDSLENIRVLDLCGAPGGKSTILSEIIGPKSLLVANEVIRQRAAVLAETLTKWGSGNTLVTQNDPAVFSRYPGYFDLILVDAPCSGEGMFRSSVAIEEWSVENTAHCSERQKRILMDIWPALKENGILIYSTCTFNPGENEENIKWLIDKHEAEIINLDITDYNSITEIDYQGISGYGFYPDKVQGEGYFISVIKKKGKQEAKHQGNRRKPELKPGKTDISIANDWTHFPDNRLLKWGDEVFALPCEMSDYLYLFQNLKIVKAGTKVFVVKKNDYLPSHEIALSNALKENAFLKVEIDLSTAISYLRRDNISIKNELKGWTIVTYKNVNLGFIKNLITRVNNYFPVEWRIRMALPEAGMENTIEWDNNF